MPAQSPTLSPTLSAMVAGLRGSSSGMPASTLPTRSAPTSAALVKMPPPTRRNSASSEPPKPKPTRIAELVFWKIMMMIVAPSRPRPTVNMPATPPVRNATFSAAGSEPDLAAAAVRTLPRTARLMPMKPVRPDMKQPATNASVRKMPGLGEAQRLGAVGLQHRGRGDEHDDDERDEDDADGLELAAQVGAGALLDRGGDLDHLRRALVGGEHAAHQGEADEDGEQGGAGREDQPEPLLPAELEGLVAALGGEDVKHEGSLRSGDFGTAKTTVLVTKTSNRARSEQGPGRRLTLRARSGPDRLEQAAWSWSWRVGGVDGRRAWSWSSRSCVVDGGGRGRRRGAADGRVVAQVLEQPVGVVVR